MSVYVYIYIYVNIYIYIHSYIYIMKDERVPVKRIGTKYMNMWEYYSYECIYINKYIHL